MVTWDTFPKKRGKGVKLLGIKLTTHLYLVAEVKKTRVDMCIPPYIS
jgi:hypothetical protein